MVGDFEAQNGFRKSFPWRRVERWVERRERREFGVERGFGKELLYEMVT